MIRRDSAQGVSRTSFPVSFRTRIGAINQRGRLYRLQTWSWWLGTVRKSWCNAWVFPTWTTSLASSLAPLAAIKGHQNCCNHRLGVFKTVSRVLGIYKGIPRTCLSLQLFFFWRTFVGGTYSRTTSNAIREELEADIVLSAYLSINFWNFAETIYRIRNQDCRMRISSCYGGLMLMCGLSWTSSVMNWWISWNSRRYPDSEGIQLSLVWTLNSRRTGRRKSSEDLLTTANGTFPSYYGYLVRH